MGAHSRAMTAIACLRVLLPEGGVSADPDTLAALVGKIGGAFLEGCWNWPRRWGAIAPFAFALADPRVDRLDPRELQALVTELHHKLFGDQGDGDVCLIVLESRQDDIMRFAAAEPGLLREMIEKGGAAVYGALTTVTPDEIKSLVTLDTRPPYPDGKPALPAGPPPDAMSLETADRGFRGVYHTQREFFVGGVVAARADPRAPLWSVVDGLADMPLAHVTEHDFACLEAASRAAGSAGGVIFVPINYSALVHGAARRAYEPMIAQLPLDQRHRLAASVYDTPREPLWSAMSQIKGLLGPNFGLINLQVADPAFAVDSLPDDAGITSVTYALPQGDEKVRLLAARRFMEGVPAFRKHRVLPGLANIGTRRELTACLALKAPFVTGRAVSATLRALPGTDHVAVADLPLRRDAVRRRDMALI
ncbi:MAG: hypothetical protein JWP35_1513 [Caulobacter sp.]|nr:hypothetical protein [Caulobacter sp.]